ncbi:MAG: Xaa-Pro aminopeptidase [Acidiferrobacteraceae bacterium]
MDLKHLHKRRDELMRLMGHGVAIVPTAPVSVRNRDVTFPYRPDSDFYYLTGFPEPEALAVFVPERPEGRFVLFCRERDPERELWDGRRAGPEGAREIYGADEAYPLAMADTVIPALLENREKIFYSMGRHTGLDGRTIGWLNEVRSRARSGVAAPAQIVDLDHILHELRLIKRPEEITRMRQAARISAGAHCRAMSVCRAGLHEYELEAELLYEFRKHGAESPAYSPIVGGGENGCILHYTENRAVLRDGDLVLIDAAAEFDGYAADITRTFPVNGRFSGAQRDVYEVVLAAQQAAIAEVRPGNHWNEPHDRAVRVLTEGLISLGLISGTVDDAVATGAYRRFYMHRTGHWLGLDVHDVGDYKVDGEWRLFEPGMTLTVEPGLYIRAADDIDPRFRNIGIRIEDDVLVTQGGCEVLTEGTPKAIDDIERLMQSQGRSRSGGRQRA